MLHKIQDIKNLALSESSRFVIVRSKNMDSDNASLALWSNRVRKQKSKGFNTNRIHNSLVQRFLPRLRLKILFKKDSSFFHSAITDNAYSKSLKSHCAIILSDSLRLQYKCLTFLSDSAISRL